MHGTLLLALLMERNNQEKWSEDICFRVIVLKNIVDWMLSSSFSSEFLSDRCCLVCGNPCADCVYCLKTVFYEWSKEVPRSVKLRSLVNHM